MTNMSSQQLDEIEEAIIRDFIPLQMIQVSRYNSDI